MGSKQQRRQPPSFAPPPEAEADIRRFVSTGQVASRKKRTRLQIEVEPELHLQVLDLAHRLTMNQAGTKKVTFQDAQREGLKLWVAQTMRQLGGG